MKLPVKAMLDLMPKNFPLAVFESSANDGGVGSVDVADVLSHDGAATGVFRVRPIAAHLANQLAVYLRPGCLVPNDGDAFCRCAPGKEKQYWQVSHTPILTT